ncbi:MAG: PQQ-binding-like beta-propeller repeat protein [Myxococcota bacterium]
MQLARYSAVVVLALAASEATSQNWPQFRGPRASGVAEGPPTPVRWDVEKGENVAWKTPVPGLAHSSPVIWGGRLFVTSVVRAKGKAELSSLYGSPGYGAGESLASESEQSFLLYCLDKDSGEILWKRTAHQGIPKVKRHPKSSHANPTPACDAGHVVACFGSEGLYCYDHAGKLLWKRDLGVLNSGAPGYPDKEGYQWGFASSPVIWRDRVFVQCDHEGQSFVAGLNLDDGEDVWRVPREENSTWCTPTVHASAAGGQLILNGYRHIGGYDLASGKEIWKLRGGGDVPVPTPVVAHDLVFLTSSHGRSRPIRAVRVEAQGLLGSDPGEEEHLAWVHPRRGIYMQTPIVCGELLYLCSDGGVLACYDAVSGRKVYRERLGAGRTGFSASAVACDGKLYFSGENGEIFVLEVGPEFRVLAVNDMGDTCLATPAISDGTLFFRTRHRVVAVR